jgi:hypothetical protein
MAACQHVSCCGGSVLHTADRHCGCLAAAMPVCHTNTGMTAALALLRTTQFGLALHWRYIGEPAHEKNTGVGHNFGQACDLLHKCVLQLHTPQIIISHVHAQDWHWVQQQPLSLRHLGHSPMMC